MASMGILIGAGKGRKFVERRKRQTLSPEYWLVLFHLWCCRLACTEEGTVASLPTKRQKTKSKDRDNTPNRQTDRSFNKDPVAPTKPLPPDLSTTSGLMSSLVCSSFLFMFVLFGSFGRFVRTCAFSWRCCVTTTNVSLLQHAWCMLRGARPPPPPPGQECTRAGVSLTPTGPMGPTDWQVDTHAAWVSSRLRGGAAPFASVSFQRRRDGVAACGLRRGWRYASAAARSHQGSPRITFCHFWSEKGIVSPEQPNIK